MGNPPRRASERRKSTCGMQSASRRCGLADEKGGRPSRYASQERKGTRRNLQMGGHGSVANRVMPVCASECDEAHEEAEEDGDEDDVGAKGAYQVHQTEHAHEEEEEACFGQRLFSL